MKMRAAVYRVADSDHTEQTNAYNIQMMQNNRSCQNYALKNRYADCHIKICCFKNAVT